MRSEPPIPESPIHLPAELWLQILSYLPLALLKRVSLISRAIRALALLRLASCVKPVLPADGSGEQKDKGRDSARENVTRISLARPCLSRNKKEEPTATEEEFTKTLAFFSSESVSILVRKCWITPSLTSKPWERLGPVQQQHPAISTLLTTLLPTFTRLTHLVLSDISFTRATFSPLCSTSTSSAFPALHTLHLISCIAAERLDALDRIPGIQNLKIEHSRRAENRQEVFDVWRAVLSPDILETLEVHSSPLCVGHQGLILLLILLASSASSFSALRIISVGENIIFPPGHSVLSLSYWESKLLPLCLSLEELHYLPDPNLFLYDDAEEPGNHPTEDLLTIGSQSVPHYLLPRLKVYEGPISWAVGLCCVPVSLPSVDVAEPEEVNGDAPVAEERSGEGEPSRIEKKQYYRPITHLSIRGDQRTTAADTDNVFMLLTMMASVRGLPAPSIAVSAPSEDTPAPSLLTQAERLSTLAIRVRVLSKHLLNTICETCTSLKMLKVHALWSEEDDGLEIPDEQLDTRREQKQLCTWLTSIPLPQTLEQISIHSTGIIYTFTMGDKIQISPNNNAEDGGDEDNRWMFPFLDWDIYRTEERRKNAMRTRDGVVLTLPTLSQLQQAPPSLSMMSRSQPPLLSQQLPDLMSMEDMDMDDMEMPSLGFNFSLSHPAAPPAAPSTASLAPHSLPQANAPTTRKLYPTPPKLRLVEYSLREGRVFARYDPIGGRMIRNEEEVV